MDTLTGPAEISQLGLLRSHRSAVSQGLQAQRTQFHVKEQAQACELKSSVCREAAQRLTETLALYQTNLVTPLWFTNPFTNHSFQMQTVNVLGELCWKYP